MSNLIMFSYMIKLLNVKVCLPESNHEQNFLINYPNDMSHILIIHNGLQQCLAHNNSMLPL